jgi:hypothetical protein
LFFDWPVFPLPVDFPDLSICCWTGLIVNCLRPKPTIDPSIRFAVCCVLQSLLGPLFLCLLTFLPGQADS